MPTTAELETLTAPRRVTDATAWRHVDRRRRAPSSVRSERRAGRWALPRAIGATATPGLIAIGALCVALPLMVSALSGNLTIPHNDAWSMSRITQTFATTGQIRLLNWNDMNLIGQVVMLGPLGSSLAVQQSAVALLALLCLGCVHRLLSPSLTRRDALLGTLLLGLWPGWAALSTSFETDVPTFAATFAALLMGRRALARDSVAWLAAALAVSLWAVSIREQAIVAPLAILIHAWVTRRARRRLDTRVLGLAAGILAAGLAGFEAWRWSLPLGQNPAPTAGPLHFLSGLATYGSRTYFTLGLVLSPAVLIGAARHRWSRRDGGALAAGLLLVVLAWRCGGVVGRYLDPSGEYAQVLPGRRVVVAPGLWHALLVLGAISGTLLIAVARERWRSADPLLGLFTILTGAEIVAVGAAGHAVYDRYLPALVPGVLALVLSGAPAARATDSGRVLGARGAAAAAAVRGCAAGALVLIGVVSAMLAANGFAFDGARWRVAQRVAGTGVAPSRIAAGLEWSGWHSPRGMMFGDGRAGDPGGWTLAFSRRPACVVVAPSPLRGPAAARWTPDGSYAYRTFLIAGEARLYLYRTHAAGCPV